METNQKKYYLFDTLVKEIFEFAGITKDNKIALSTPNDNNIYFRLKEYITLYCVVIDDPHKYDNPTKDKAKKKIIEEELGLMYKNNRITDKTLEDIISNAKLDYNIDTIIEETKKSNNINYASGLPILFSLFVIFKQRDDLLIGLGIILGASIVVYLFYFAKYSSSKKEELTSKDLKKMSIESLYSTGIGIALYLIAYFIF